jgi:HEAT repeat protein
MSSFTLSSMIGTRAVLLATLLLTSGCILFKPRPPVAPSVTDSAPGSAAEPATTAVEGAFNDDPRPPNASEAAVIAAGLDPVKLAAVERTLLAKLQDPAATPAARQEAAQSLGLALLAGPSGAHAGTLLALAPMLTDPARVDNARLALDRVPGPQVDAIYLNAIANATGRTGLAVIESIGARASPSAVPALAALVNDTDPATAVAAIRALGHIGGANALAAIEKASNPLDPDVLNARLAAAARTDAANAAFVANDIYRNPAAPLAQRSAALRGLIAASPEGLIDEIHAALVGAEPAFQAVALESVATLGPAVSLIRRLPSYAPAVQVSLIKALGTRGDAGAVPGLMLVLDWEIVDARLAAIEALGRLPGDIDVATRLATLATGKDDVAKAAFASLSRLNGPGLDEFILTSAASDDFKVPFRAVLIQQLAARNQTEAIPFLIGLRSSPEETLRLEALDALRAIGTEKEQVALIAWAMGAAKAEQNRAVRAIIAIILRDGNVATRAGIVVNTLNGRDPATRLALLPVLSRVAGPAALSAAGSLAFGEDETVATAATAELTRWPDATALPVLVDLATRGPGEAVRTAATQGATRVLSQSAGVPPADRSAHARALLALPVDSAARLALINVLSLCADQPALDAAKSFLADPATAAVAQDAVDAITSNMAGPPIFTASSARESAIRAGDGKLKTYWSVPLVPGEWLRADLHHSRPVRKITLEQGGREWDFPASVDIQVSDDPDQPGETRVQAEGERYRTVISLPAGVRGRYLWIRQTGTRSGPWAVAELLVE